MNHTQRRRRTSVRRSAIALIAVLAAVAVSACALPARNAPKTYVKPPAPPNVGPVVTGLTKIADATFSADYSVSGVEVSAGQASIALAPPRGRLDVLLGGLTLNVYFTVSPLSAVACAIVSGLRVGCDSLAASPASGNPAATILSPQTYDTLVGLFASGGGKITPETLVGTPGLCLETPATAQSPTIRLCVAIKGGILFYSNGQVTIQATRYSPTFDQSILDPPTGAAAKSQLL